MKPPLPLLLLIGGLSLASCHSPPPPEISSIPSPPAVIAPSVTPTVSPPAAPPTEDGGYYLDDGPPVDDGIDIASLPDAVVRHETINPRKNLPYIALGKRYLPYQTLVDYRRQGVASWYGKRYHGRPTASGEIYDLYKMTAAHPLLPIPSYARVTRVDDGRSVIVRINDRGPFLAGRLIDLSYAAAARLGIVKTGTGEVIVKSILPSGTAPHRSEDSENRITAAPQKPAVASEAKKIYIQLGAYSTRAAALAKTFTLKQVLPTDFHDKIGVGQTAQGLFNARIGPYHKRSDAAADDKIICGTHAQCGFLISD